MKKVLSAIFTVIGWLMMLLCLGGTAGGIGTLANSANNPDTVKLTLLLACGSIVGFLIILRHKLFRRKEKNIPRINSNLSGQAGKKTGKGRYYVRAVICVYLAFAGGFALFSYIPQTLHAEWSYTPFSRLAAVTLAVIVIVLLGILRFIHIARKTRREGSPLSKAFYIIIIVFILLEASTSFFAFRSEHNDVPSPLLTERQKADWTSYLSLQEWETLPFGHVAAGTKAADGTWVAVLLPAEDASDESAAEDCRIFAWSEANWWAGISWQERKPSSDDVNSITTAVLCRYGVWSATYGQYSWDMSGTTGSSEYVDICYINLETGEIYDCETFGNELPESATEVPHYTISEEDLVEHIRNHMRSLASANS